MNETDAHLKDKIFKIFECLCLILVFYFIIFLNDI